MSKKSKILIADRNRHVREFIMREMAAEGYQCRPSKSAWEVLNTLMEEGPIDMLILDLDLPGVKEIDLLKIIERERPTLPIIFHSLLSDYITNQPPRMRMAAFVEKDGNSIKDIKKIVSHILGHVPEQVTNHMGGKNALAKETSNNEEIL